MRNSQWTIREVNLRCSTPHQYRIVIVDGCGWWQLKPKTTNNSMPFHASHWRERARVNGPFESELRAISMRIILLRSLTMKMQKRRRRRSGKKKQQNIGNSTHIIIDINQGMHFRFGREMCRAWSEHPLALFSILCRKCKHQTNLMHTHTNTFTTHLFRFGATFRCLDKFGASVCVCMFFLLWSTVAWASLCIVKQSVVSELNICHPTFRWSTTIIVKIDVSTGALNLPVHWNRKSREISFNETACFYFERRKSV